MKGLSIEEKAEAYDKALERALKLRVQNPFDTVSQMMEHVFPELKESEDEKIRKAILVGLINCRDAPDMGWTNFGGVSIDKCIAWLEKQGWQPRYSIGDVLCDKSCTTLNKDAQPNFEIVDIRNGMYICDKGSFPISQQDEYELVAKKIEQKPADKVEPKFHEGDWVIGRVTENEPRQIAEISEEGYRTTYGGWIGFSFEEDLHLWTIQDAKDGDVVVDKSDGAIGIFQSIGHHPNGGSCNDPSYCFLHCRYDDGFFYADFEHGNMIDSDDLIPATKEKRDLLFKKMHEAGYEWDSEKKELKKTENEIEIPFGAKDSELQEATYYYYIPKGFHAEIDNDKVVIKKGEKPAEWSEDDALRLEEVICMIEANGRLVRSDDALKLVLDWLKSLRPRIMGLK